MLAIPIGKRNTLSDQTHFRHVTPDLVTRSFSTIPVHSFSETTDSAKNTSAPVIYISETKLAALFNQWSSLESDVSLERSCLGENEPPRWEARRTTNLRLGEATAALLDHVQWDHVVILTDGASDGELPRALGCI